MRKSKPPSVPQIDYIRTLGYTGQPPQTSREASAIIDAMKRTRDSAAGEAAMLEERRKAPRRARQEAQQHAQEVRQFQRDGVVGFRFERIPGEPVEPEEKHLPGVYVHLSEYASNPQLLDVSSLEYEELFANEWPKRGGRFLRADGTILDCRRPRNQPGAARGRRQPAPRGNGRGFLAAVYRGVLIAVLFVLLAIIGLIAIMLWLG